MCQGWLVNQKMLQWKVSSSIVPCSVVEKNLTLICVTIVFIYTFCIFDFTTFIKTIKCFMCNAVEYDKIYPHLMPFNVQNEKKTYLAMLILHMALATY